jgi:hypothetical protein
LALDIIFPLLIERLASWAQQVDAGLYKMNATVDKILGLLSTLPKDMTRLNENFEQLWNDKDDSSTLAAIIVTNNTTKIHIEELLRKMSQWIMLLRRIPMAWYRSKTRNTIIPIILLLDRLLIECHNIYNDTSVDACLTSALQCRHLLYMLLRNYPESHVLLTKSAHFVLWTSETWSLSTNNSTDNTIKTQIEWQKTNKNIISSIIK